MKKKFLRRDWNKILRLGGRRKKLKWRRSKGRHAKIRQKWKGYPKMPSVGYKSPKISRGLIKNKKPIMIKNVSDLEKIKDNEIGIISATVGKKKRLEIAKKALELKIKFVNLDAQKYIEKIKREQESKKIEEEKKQKEEKNIDNKNIEK
ncbi:MAG: eL32 family ribosomal protein [Candidatus Pacearchaeota archaeon]